MPSGNEEKKVESIHRRDYAWVKHAVTRARSAFVLNLDEERFEEQALESVEGPQDELSLAVDTYPVDLFGGFNLELMGRIIALYPRR
jgi:hypothetical protein